MKAAAAMLALSVLTGPGTPHYAGLPPERFQGPATVTLKIVAPEHLVATCGSDVPPGLELMGCAMSDWLGRRYVVMPDPCRNGASDETARILCHEVGHAAHGWPGDHPL
jgi:hypothetical protein